MIVFLLKNKSQLTIQKLIPNIIEMVMYRTSWGLKLMDSWAKRWGQIIQYVSLVSIGVAVIGMVYVTVLIVQITIKFLLAPATTETGVSLVLPGMTIPGLGKLSFFHWLLALTILIVVHEFGHGVVARAHKVKIKYSGFAFLSLFKIPIIPAAFVEPDEIQLKKENDIVQNSIFAAGPIANFILTIVILLLLNYAFYPLQSTMTSNAGVTFENINETLPAAIAGLTSGMIITGIDDSTINTYDDLTTALQTKTPGQEIVIHTDQGNYPLVLAANPADTTKPYLGITQIKQPPKKGLETLYAVYEWFLGLCYWTWMLSFLIGIMNLLPIFITDGGRIVHTSMKKILGDEKKALKASVYINGLITICFLVLIIGSLIKWVGKFG